MYYLGVNDCRSALKPRSKKVERSRFSSYLPIENPSKQPGASRRRKLKSHSIRAAGMRSKIHTCQPETVPLIAFFLLDVVKQMVK